MMDNRRTLDPAALKLLQRVTRSLIQEHADPMNSIEKLEPIQRKIEYDSESVKNILKLKSPFIHLTEREKNELVASSFFIEYNGKAQEVLTLELIPPEIEQSYPCCVVISGTLIVIDTKSQDIEVLSKGDSFGVDACLFDDTSYKVMTVEKSPVIVMKIPKNHFKTLMHPEKHFTAMVGSNLLNKQRVFAPIETFRNYVAECVQSGEINLKKLLKAYRAIDSSLHPNRKSPNLDIPAWRYAIQRLPENLCNTFVYFISTSLPDLYNNEKIITNVKTAARLRMIFCLVNGKNFIIMRELVSDINDMLANLCIHVTESKKLRNKLKEPGMIREMIDNNSIDHLPLDLEERKGLKKIWKDKVVEQVKNIIVHHEDYKISIYIPSSHLKLSPIELWTEKLWEEIMNALDLKGTSVVEAIDRGLIVDFMQGSTRTILNTISPYILQNKDRINEWFQSSGKALKSTDLEDERDILIAKSFYFLENFKEERVKREEMEREAGIYTVNITHNTGVKVIIVNIDKLSKFNPQYNPKSKYHILLYIGFTFGKQSYDLVKNINLLLGKSINSYTVVGKAGGLTGKRNDILVASKFFDEISKNVMRANPAGVSKTYLQKETGSTVYIGPMLTVSGTILQNRKLLLYYRIIEGCIGLEMEGAYIAQSIKDSIEAGIIKDDVSTRFIYYISDLPLKSDSTLASEDDNVNWDEGVKSVNGIVRYVLGLINRKLIPDISSQTIDQVQRSFKTQSKIVVIGTNTENMNVFHHHTASKLAEELLTTDYSVIYLTPVEGIKPFMRRISQAYIQSSGFFPEAVAIDLRRKKELLRQGKLVIIEYSSHTDYLNKLHFIAEKAREVPKIPILFTDPPTDVEVLTGLNGTECIKIKRKFEKIKKDCPGASLVFFRTDLDNGEIDQKQLREKNKFSYVFTRYKESTVVDVVSVDYKESITAHPSNEVLRKIHEIIRNVLDDD